MQKINNQQSKSKTNGGKEDGRSVAAATGGQWQRGDSNGGGDGNGGGNGNGNGYGSNHGNGGRQWLH
jgi:hypothetical protein